MALTLRTLLIAFLFVVPVQAQAGGADTLVVCPRLWQAELADWVAFRQSQGHAIQIVSPATTAGDTRSIIHRHLAVGGIRWVVLVGDAGKQGKPVASNETPTFFPSAEINRRWGSDAELATDHEYVARVDPSERTSALGRIPCDTPAELRDYLARVRAFEQDQAGELEEQRLTLVAAPGNFSPLLDRVIETTAARILTQLTPPTCALHMTYADWRSSYCPYPPRFAQAVQQGLQRRSTAWVYLGHGHRHTLDRLQTPAGHARILDDNLVSSLKGNRFPPLAALIACYAGSFDGPDDCLAEQLLKQPGGPLATLAGSRVTMPYGNSVLGLELLQALFEQPSNPTQPPTLGEMVAIAKQRALAPGAKSLRKTVEQIATGFTPDQTDRAQERLEHVRMYNLLGDPLLRLRRSMPMKIAASVDPAHPLRLRVEGSSPLAGRCRLHVVPLKYSAVAMQSGRKQFQLGDTSQREYEQMYQQTNHRSLAEQTMDVAAGPYSATIDLPPETAGQVVLVCHVAGGKGLAAGQASVLIR